jgi:glyoxylase I family protein
MPQIHHAAICTRDVETSVQFWRDGLGFVVMMDHSFDGDWPTLFGARSTSLRSIFLGDPDHPDSGIVELVDFGTDLEARAPDAGPALGFFLLSVYTDLPASLARLDSIGLGGPPRRTVTAGVHMAVVRDPNGVRVELIDR